MFSQDDAPTPASSCLFIFFILFFFQLRIEQVNHQQQMSDVKYCIDVYSSSICMQSVYMLGSVHHMFRQYYYLCMLWGASGVCIVHPLATFSGRYQMCCGVHVLYSCLVLVQLCIQYVQVQYLLHVYSCQLSIVLLLRYLHALFIHQHMTMCCCPLRGQFSVV